jgi:hypothetical protein
MFQESGLATHSRTLQCRQTTSSTAAEKEVFIELLQEAKNDMEVEVVTTDGHLGIAKHMRENETITHNQVIQ